jgi:HD superfamily phosphohydrolase
VDIISAHALETKGVIIYDTLYGKFNLPAFLGPLLNAPEFRRLTEVRLININSPTLSGLAEVRRYSHTLGVLRLAVLNPLLNFGDDEFRALLASIIVHDVGTPAFAHLFEYQLNDRFDWNHEAVLPSVLTKQHHVDGSINQFYASRVPMFEKLCRTSGIDFVTVLKILERRHPASKLVFGSVDFDNLDNVARMSWMLGNRFDLGIVFELAASLGADSTAPVLLPEKQRGNLEEWAALRRRAYEVIVFDGPTVAGQAVLSTLIREALETGILSVMDWNYTDYELINVLRDMSSEAKTRLQRDFFGPLPQMHLLMHVKDKAHPIFGVSKNQLTRLIAEFLKERRVPHPYGYCLRDKGTFEKQIIAIDPETGSKWSVGTTSDSLILYGFGGGSCRQSPEKMGSHFLNWFEGRQC